MKETKSNYYVTNSIYQAQALSYLGFRYQKHTDKYTGNIQYTFEKTEKLLNAISAIKALRIAFNNEY